MLHKQTPKSKALLLLKIADFSLQIDRPFKPAVRMFIKAPIDENGLPIQELTRLSTDGKYEITM